MKTAITLAVTELLISVFSITSFAQESHWKLTSIKTTIMPLAPMNRESKDLPLDNHQQRNVSWIGSVDNKELKITADILFTDVPAIISAGNTMINPDFLIKAGGSTPFADYIIFRATADLETISGFQKKDSYGFLEHLVYNNTHKEIGCGVRITNIIPKEDFTLNFRLYVNFGGINSNQLAYERDVSYHLFYKWMGDATATTTTGNCFSADPAAAVSARDVHFNWAEKQEAAVLDQNLGYKLQLLSDCKVMTDTKIHDLFGDISVIVANYVTAECFPDDAGAVIKDRAEHVQWAATQTRSTLIKNLHYKLKDAINCLNRSQQNSFFTDVSVVMATAVR
jgi:hypothetical protein